MDIFSFLSYINKLSLLAFFITTVVVGYQIYNLKKEKKNEQKPSIPDFRDVGQSTTANYTRLPNSLTKKTTGTVNYSKLIFLVILLLTVIVIIVVVALIKKNNSSLQSLPNETSPKNNGQLAVNKISPAAVISIPAHLTPTTVTPTVRPTVAVSPTVIVLPTLTKNLSPSPTEIILAKAPTLTPTVSISNLSPTQSIPKTLPETGSIEKALLIIGVGISTIFFSFWL